MSKTENKGFRARLVELFSRTIAIFDKTNEIYQNGDDNDYPYRVERVINNSVTGKLAANKMKDYLVGQGFPGDLNEFIVNSVKNIDLYQILNGSARSLVYQQALTIHVNFDIEGRPNLIEVIPFKKVRVSREDSFGRFGRFWVSDDWTKESESKMKRRKGKNNSEKSSLRWYYPYNTNIDVINAQRRRDFELSGKDESEMTAEEIAIAMVQGYRGQIFYYNPEEETIYPNALIDAAYNDADTEYRISVFRNDQVRNKFIGATIVTIEAQDEPVISDDQIRGLLGEDEGSNILVLEVDRDENGELKQAVKVDTVQSEVDTERFTNDENRIEENILNSFNNIPRILVKGGDNSIFSSSGEALRTAESIYQRNTQSEREAIERCLTKILEGFPRLTGELTIVPLIEERTNGNNQPS